MVKKALQRLGWRFSEAAKRPDKSFKVNQKDIEALKTLDKAIEEQQKEQFANNELFAKMFILMYMKVLEKDGTTVFDKHARRKICEFLKLPMGNIIQKFTDFMNDTEWNNLMDELGIEIKHPATLSDKERELEQEKINEALKTPYNEKRFMREVWDEETVKDCLTAEVNQAIEICG